MEEREKNSRDRLGTFVKTTVYSNTPNKKGNLMLKLIITIALNVFVKEMIALKLNVKHVFDI